MASVPSLYGIYDRRKVYPPLYNIIYGRYATSKGELEAVRHIAAPIRQEMRQRWEEVCGGYEIRLKKKEKLEE